MDCIRLDHTGKRLQIEQPNFTSGTSDPDRSSSNPNDPVIDYHLKQRFAGPLSEIKNY